MTWRDRIWLKGKGSFRDNEFYVSSADRSAGRRTVVHEFPGSDNPMIEDLGESQRPITLNAYVMGQDYMVDRDKLWLAFREPGPGKLVHPFWGVMRVTVVGQIRMRETFDEGGMARFTLTVVEDKEVVPVVVADTAEEVKKAADDVNEALGEDYEDKEKNVGFIESVRNATQALINGVNGVTSEMNKIKGKINAAMNIVDDFSNAITALGDTAAALILAPGQLVQSIKDITGNMMQAISTVTDAWDSYFDDDEGASNTSGSSAIAALGSTAATGDQRVDLLMASWRSLNGYGEDFVDIEETTATQTANSDNQTAMVDLMRGLALSEACRAMVDIPFSSYDQAVAVRDELLGALDDRMDTADDISYQSLFDLRAAMARHLADASANLPRVITYTPAKNLPALVVAQLLYGDASRDIDIIDRNKLRNPCIIQGGESLEVLSDV